MKIKELGLTKFIVAAAVVIVAAILLSGSIVSVYEDKYVCIKRFNKIIADHSEPGIKFKIPFVDEAVEIPKNAMVYNLDPSEVLTLDKKAMTVSSYAVWRITDPLKFLQTAVTLTQAESRIDNQVYSAVKNLLSSMNQTDAISSRGRDLDENIAATVRAQMYSYGVEIIDIQIKQFDLPQDNKSAVYARMISEREQTAAQFNAEGSEEAEKIKNSADKDALLIKSQALADAEQLIGEGESAYMRTIAAAYSTPERAEFYEFMRSLDALKTSMTGEKTIILPIDSPLTKWFITK